MPIHFSRISNLFFFITIGIFDDIISRLFFSSKHVVFNYISEIYEPPFIHTEFIFLFFVHISSVMKIPCSDMFALISVCVASIYNNICERLYLFLISIPYHIIEPNLLILEVVSDYVTPFLPHLFHLAHYYKGFKWSKTHPNVHLRITF